MTIDIVFGVIVPGSVLIFSFLMSHLLFRHFSRASEDDGKPDTAPTEKIEA